MMKPGIPSGAPGLPEVGRCAGLDGVHPGDQPAPGDGGDRPQHDADDQGEADEDDGGPHDNSCGQAQFFGMRQPEVKLTNIAPGQGDVDVAAPSGTAQCHQHAQQD